MSNEVRFLTMAELCVKLRISDDTARIMLKKGLLVGIRTGREGRLGGEWRIVDPGPRFERYLRELDEHLLHVPLLSAHEVAAILNTNYCYVWDLMKKGKLKRATQEGKRHQVFFTVAEVRRYMTERKNRKMALPRKRTVLLLQLVQWAKQILAQENAENAAGGFQKDEMDAMVNQLLTLPEPARSQSLHELFQKLDKAQFVVQVAKTSPSL